MKEPNWKTPLILLAVLGAFGGFAYWLQYSHKPKKEKADTAHKKPLIISATDQILSFKVKGKSGFIEGRCNDVAQKKCTVGGTGADQGSWTIVYPKPVKADPSIIREFLTAVTDVVAPELIDLSEETPEKRKALFKEYGLTEEDRSKSDSRYVEINLEGGKKKAVWIGQDHPMGDKSFAASSEDGVMNEKEVYLLTNYYNTNLEHDLTYFRDKTIFNFDHKKIGNFTAKTTNGPLIGSKASGLWTVNNIAADYDRVDVMLSSFAQMKAKAFPEGDPVKGLKPVVQYELTGDHQDVYTLALYDRSIPLPGKNEGAKKAKPEMEHVFYAKTTSPIPATKPGEMRASLDPEGNGLFEVNAVVKTQLDKKLNDLRRHEIFSQTEKVTATKLTVEGSAFKAPATFELQAGKWAAQDKASTLDAGKVVALLEALNTTKIYDFVPNTKAPLSMMNEQVRVIVGDDKNPQKFKYVFYTSGGKIYAMNLNETTHKEALLMDNVIESALPLKPDAWKKK